MRGAVALLALAAVALLALAACGVPQPLNREIDPPAGAAAAAAIVVNAWAERLPHASRLDVADAPPIRWFEGDCLRYGDPCSADGGYVTSPWDEPEIHLIVRASLRESALAHEALHWAHDELEGDPDHDHQAAAWERVVDVEAALEEVGL